MCNASKIDKLESNNEFSPIHYYTGQRTQVQILYINFFKAINLAIFGQLTNKFQSHWEFLTLKT